MRRMRAQALVEFAFVLPIIVLILFTLLDASELFRSTMIAHEAASEAAIYYAQYPDATEDEIGSHVRMAVSGADGSDFSLKVEPLSADREHEYTMRTLGADGWKSVEAKSVSVQRNFTAKKRFHSYLSQLLGGPDLLVASGTVRGTSTTEGVER